MPILPALELMHIFGFTADDLASNRAGRISERQMERLKRKRDIRLRFISITLGIGIILFLVSIIVNNKAPSEDIVGSFLFSMLLPAPISLFFYLGVLDAQTDISKNKAQVYSGSLYSRRKQTKLGPKYLIVTSDVDIQIDELIYLRFSEYLDQNGKDTVFRLYYTARMNELLSLENMSKYDPHTL